MPPSGIQILHHHKSATSIGTLGAANAIAIGDGAYQGSALTAGFLLKKLRGWAGIEFSADGATPDDFPLLVLAYGDKSGSEVNAAMVLEEPNPASDHLVNQATVRAIVDVIGPDIVVHHENDANNANQSYHFDLSRVELPKKGMPFPEGVGWEWHIFNPTSSSFTTGGIAHIWAKYMGVWLSD